jgi:galactonate dehydratase
VRISAAEVTAAVDHGRSVHLMVLRTDRELIGVGEIQGSGGNAGFSSAAPAISALLVGLDPFDVEAMLIASRDLSDGGTIDGGLVSAAEVAMADITGQALGIPTHQLWGGRVRDQVRACAVGWADGSAGPDEIVASALETVGLGFTALRIEPRQPQPRRESVSTKQAADVVLAIRRAVPDEVDLVVDAGSGLAAEAAIEFAELLGVSEPLWLETLAPAPWQSSPWTNLPLAGGRGASAAAMRRLVTESRVDHLVVEIGRVGGLNDARGIAALAEVYHIGVVLGGDGGSVSVAAALQLAAVIPNLSMLELRPGLAAVSGGMVEVDLSPGLGPRGALAANSEAAS